MSFVISSQRLTLQNLLSKNSLPCKQTNLLYLQVCYQNKSLRGMRPTMLWIVPLMSRRPNQHDFKPWQHDYVRDVGAVARMAACSHMHPPPPPSTYSVLIECLYANAPILNHQVVLELGLLSNYLKVRVTPPLDPQVDRSEISLLPSNQVSLIPHVFRVIYSGENLEPIARLFWDQSVRIQGPESLGGNTFEKHLRHFLLEKMVTLHATSWRLMGSEMIIREAGSWHVLIRFPSSHSDSLSKWAKLLFFFMYKKARFDSGWLTI